MSNDPGDVSAPRRLTQVTLARDLGVSAATVSNAYNRPDQLSPALRARSLGLARELEADGLGLLLHAAHAGSDVGRIRDAAVDAWVVQSLPEGSAAVEAA